MKWPSKMLDEKVGRVQNVIPSCKFGECHEFWAMAITGKSVGSISGSICLITWCKSFKHEHHFFSKQPQAADQPWLLKWQEKIEKVPWPEVRLTELSAVLLTSCVAVKDECQFPKQVRMGTEGQGRRSQRDSIIYTGAFQISSQRTDLEGNLNTESS